jgi:SAM-dependent methyltransferase
MKNSVSSLSLLLFLFLLSNCNNSQERPGGYQAGTTASDKPASTDSDKNWLYEDYASQNRLVWQKPDIVIRRLGNLTDKTVVDLGAGTGFFAFRMIPLAKKTIALDIDRRFVALMDSAKKELPPQYRDRFEVRLVDTDNAKLKKNEADAVVIVNTYMFISDRVSYMARLRTGLSKGAKVLIVDYKEKNIPVGPPVEAKVPMGTVERELRQAGFRNIQVDDTSLDYQYIIVAENP